MASFIQTNDISELQKIAHELRKDVLDMLRLAGSGHIG
jgi:transketolase N-terminal domain/subunit